MRWLPLTSSDIVADAPSTSPNARIEHAGHFQSAKKAPDSKFRTIPAPQIFKVACKDVLFPGTTLQRGGPTASALQATLNTWGKGAGGFFSQNPVPDLSLFPFSKGVPGLAMAGWAHWQLGVRMRRRRRPAKAIVGDGGRHSEQAVLSYKCGCR